MWVGWATAQPIRGEVKCSPLSSASQLSAACGILGRPLEEMRFLICMLFTLASLISRERKAPLGWVSGGCCESPSPPPPCRAGVS